MPELKLKNLEDYRDEILKAEIGALFFNLGKTHIGFWHKKDGQDYWLSHFNIAEDKFKDDFQHRFGYYPFDGYKEYYQIKREINKSPFEYELEQHGLKGFVFNQKVKFPFKIDNVNELEWAAFFKGDAIGSGEKGEEFIKKIFFRGCENINSGIDKGSPKEQLDKILWISNAFGSFRRKLELQDFDDERLCFYNRLYNFLCSNNYYINPNWKEIRKFVVDEIKKWYSKLLSDTRFPVNDVTLWDQAYMTATMFKAVLAELYMDSSDLKEFISNPTSIKWRILGIQYDKLGLSERGYKPAQIQWYRETAKEIDEEVKKLLEYDYPIGNEIYRDETGIYFLIGEKLGKDLSEDNIGELHPDLGNIKQCILTIFKDKSLDEFYPAIFVTKASRGLMSLSYLIEKAKENFLKADWSKKEIDICIDKSKGGKAVGICQLCRQRMVFESDRREEDKSICNACYENKTQGRIKEWLKDTTKETIWMDELRDRNDRVALVTMKFELKHWLNGDMLNGMLIRNEPFESNVLCIKNFILLLLSNLDINSYFDTTEIERDILELNEKLKSPQTPRAEKPKLGEKKSTLEALKRNIGKIKDLIEKIRQSKWWGEPLNSQITGSGYQNTIEELTDMIKSEYKRIKSQFRIALMENFSFFPKDLAIDAYIGSKRGSESFNDLIRQLFFASIIGTPWEEWIKNSFLNSKINWNQETINWLQLTDEDIDFLSRILLQFLLRKNPSPARLRRIWESTKEFFEEIEKNMCAYAGIPEERRKRYYWENVTNVTIEDGDYRDGEALFWANEGKVYLISYLKDLSKDTSNDKKFSLKRIAEKYLEQEEKFITELVFEESKTEFYQPYMSITDPTPISWQFIIPAEYVPNLIDNVMKKYDEYFRFVYGKLPLHIGVVIQDYKKPLYVGIKALRKIRRDVEDIEKLQITVEASKIKDKLKYQRLEESLNDTPSYYSLYWGEHTQGYEFYIKPAINTKECNDISVDADECHDACASAESSRKWMCSIGNIDDEKRVCIIPNTFDFEFMDTNTRRNDIYYSEGCGYKRLVPSKDKRPYEIEAHWGKFKTFKNVFKDERHSSRLQKLVYLIYDKFDLENASLAVFTASAFINILEPQRNKEFLDMLIRIFDVDESCIKNGGVLIKEKLYEQLKIKLSRERLKLFLDMFEFWHKALKEV
jgi:CRISPR-associated Csx11 family protein